MTTKRTLPEDLLRQVESHAAREGSDLNDAVVNLLRIGLASASEAESAPEESLLERRRALTQNFVSGEWGVELAGYEEARAVDRRKAAERANAWSESEPCHLSSGSSGNGDTYGKLITLPDEEL